MYLGVFSLVAAVGFIATVLIASFKQMTSAKFSELQEGSEKLFIDELKGLMAQANRNYLVFTDTLEENFIHISDPSFEGRGLYCLKYMPLLQDENVDDIKNKYQIPDEWEIEDCEKGNFNSFKIPPESWTSIGRIAHNIFSDINGDSDYKVKVSIRQE